MRSSNFRTHIQSHQTIIAHKISTSTFTVIRVFSSLLFFRFRRIVFVYFIYFFVSFSVFFDQCNLTLRLPNVENQQQQQQRNNKIEHTIFQLWSLRRPIHKWFTCWALAHLLSSTLLCRHERLCIHIRRKKSVSVYVWARAYAYTTYARLTIAQTHMGVLLGYFGYFMVKPTVPLHMYNVVQPKICDMRDVYITFIKFAQECFIYGLTILNRMYNCNPKVCACAFNNQNHRTWSICTVGKQNRANK